MYRDWYSKPPTQITENELVGLRRVNQEVVRLLGRVHRIDTSRISVQIINRTSTEPWQMEIDRYTTVSIMGDYEIGYVGPIPDSISGSHDMILGYMNGRRRDA